MYDKERFGYVQVSFKKGGKKAGALAEGMKPFSFCSRMNHIRKQCAKFTCTIMRKVYAPCRNEPLDSYAEI